MSVFMTPVTVRFIERFGVRSVMIAGVVLLALASGALGVLTLSFWPPLVLVLTALMGVPYGVVSTASNQGLYVSARPEDREWRPGFSRRADTSGHHGDGAHWCAVRSRREPGKLGAHGVGDAGVERGGVCVGAGLAEAGAVG
ncbi:major facilitator protein [Arthrobacter sp. Hiyo8]|nr:major facilitator protein [Arthrobacter sp. Hiyo8]